ncbi:conserved hypothetical protein [Theileria orientalis strain Shintoku]|uniref:Uncharacterized protein n=1 Tax=Theileria orientalis strain Shintoku TaxID=869250 RepID=J4CCB2_THEOR|nr:conserved hypothetical protein [Theileria orientalis strain Shintoku]BAM39087.1 conserved hypothetical protein [Theileria orientalis strain Shintoku]|eukprot:XP_009689388.1 conserved hypothetical protein [Theileria orientalis strain Shintoku]
MNFTTLSIGFVVYSLISFFNYVYSEDILLGSDFTTPDSQPKESETNSTSLKTFTNPNLSNFDINDKTKTPDLKYSTSCSTKSPDELRFFAFVPDSDSKVTELTRDQFTFKVDENNHELYHFEFKDDKKCAKIKYDDTTIWRSGEYGIPGAKYVIYNKNNDRIVVRDDERSITYRLVDDSSEQGENIDLSATEPGRADSNLGSIDSAVTYVAYVTDPVKDLKRSNVSISLVVFSLFALLVLMTLMLVGLLLLVVRLYRVVDQIKFDFGATETKVVL